MRHRARRRRLVTSIAVPLLLSGLLACQSEEQPAADDSAQAPDEETAGEPAQEQEAGPDGVLTRKTLLPALKEAVAEKQSVRMTMDLDAAGQAMTAEGNARFDSRDPVMSLSMDGAAFGGSTVELRVVDGLVYVSLPPMTPPGKFFEVDPQDPNDPLAANMGDLTSQMDPRSTFAAFDAGLRKVKYVGEESVSGEDLDRYRLSIDFAAASKAQGQPVTPGVPETVTYDLWVDDENLMRRIDFDLGRKVDMTMTMDEWGEPVTVQAPPADKIAKAPSGPTAP